MSELKSGSTIDVHEELASAKVGRLHWLLAAMLGALVFFDGYDTFNPAYVIHYVVGPWGLAPTQAGLLVSSGLVGFLIGAAGHGMIADRFGRRGTLLGGLWITNIFTLATALFANSFISFCSLRVLTGIGLGVLMPLATTYINELAPRRIVNVFALWGVALGWALGGTFAGLVGVFMTPMFGWPVLYWVGSLSILLSLVLQVTLPESVKFLALHNRADEIKALLTRLRPERAQLYAQAQFTVPETASRQNSVLALLTPRYRRVTIAIWLSAFLSLFCIFGLTGWIPNVMIQRGESFATSFGFGALMQIMSFVGGLVCGHISDRTGSSRWTLACWWAFGGASVLVLVFFNEHALNLLCVAAAGFFIIGAQFVLNNFSAASYETSYRATGVGMELGVGRVGAILGPLVAGALQKTEAGPTAMFIAIAAASMVAALAIASSGASRDAALDPVSAKAAVSG
jgi:AAHS family 4-hydroxybenzoate transporter-like MFS transporter